MHRPRRTPLVILVLLTGACSNLVDPPPPTRTPFVEAMLVADSRQSTVRVGWLDSTRPGASPVASADVALSLESDAGDTVPLEAVPEPGLFIARLKIDAGSRYRLSGTIGGRPVSAATTVPARLEVAQPVGDTLHLTADGTAANGPYRTLPFQWSASGAALFALESAYVIPTAETTTAAAGLMLVFGHQLRIVAMNRDLAEYLHRTPAATNVTGGFGVLGGASEVRKEIVWASR